MNYILDTEFIDSPNCSALISLALVREDGAELYAEVTEALWGRAQAADWIRENVLPHLVGPVLPRAEVAKRIVAFAGDKPEFWADYAAYDWVVFCQLFGTMMDLPEGFPRYCRDLKQWCDALGNPRLPEQGKGEHHALLDARWNKQVYEFLKRYEASRGIPEMPADLDAIIHAEKGR